MTTEPVKFSPCLFCGDRVSLEEVDDVHRLRFQIQCDDDLECGARGRMFNTPDDAIENWENNMPTRKFDADVVRAILDLIQADPHSWSARPCSTCRAVGSIVGQPFGCYVYAAQKSEKR